MSSPSAGPGGPASSVCTLDVISDSTGLSVTVMLKTDLFIILHDQLVWRDGFVNEMRRVIFRGRSAVTGVNTDLVGGLSREDGFGTDNKS